jgi:UDP-glucose 4-epimerase
MRILDQLGRDSIPVPHVVARPILSRLHGLGKTGARPSYVDYLRFVCMVDDTRAREVLGYEPRYTVKETIEAVDLWE